MKKPLTIIIFSVLILIVVLTSLYFLNKLPYLKQDIVQTTPSPSPYQPHITRQAELRKSPPLTTSITLPCPSVPEFCQNPKEVLNEEGGGLAIGNNIKEGSPIYAVFDGQSKLRSAIVDGEKFFQIDLINSQNNNLRAYYFLKKTGADQGTFSIKNSFKKGEVMATVSAEAIKYLGSYNLVFKLFDNEGVIPPGKVIFE